MIFTLATGSDLRPGTPPARGWNQIQNLGLLDLGPLHLEFLHLDPLDLDLLDLPADSADL